jgi:hypothetical protein
MSQGKLAVLGGYCRSGSSNGLMSVVLRHAGKGSPLGPVLGMLIWGYATVRAANPRTREYFIVVLRKECNVKERGFQFLGGS